MQEYASRRYILCAKVEAISAAILRTPVCIQSELQVIPDRVHTSY